MRVAVLIKRSTHYRLLGAVVEEALRRGWAVECWHDHGHARDNWKGHDFPGVEPKFRSGVPRFVAYRGLGELAERFEVEPPAAVICVDPPEAEVVTASSARWFWLQFATDLILHPHAGPGLHAAAALGVFSPWWTRRLRQSFESQMDTATRRKVAPVGMPMLDLVADIDPDEVRWTYGLPRSGPLVVYLPFPWMSSNHWAPRVLGWRLAGAIDDRLGPRWHDRRLVKALRAFCDRNGATLVVKARLKDPSPAYLRRAAGAHFDERQEPYHPPLILRLLACASLCVHFYSAAVIESVYCRVPSLCLAPEPAALGLDAIPNATRLYNGREGGLYNWPGAAHWRPLAEADDGLHRWGLGDFPLDPEARRRYVEKFLGFDDGRSAARFLDLVASRVGGS